MEAIIISIGDELLIGQVINSNPAFIAERLQPLGVSVRRILTIGDDEFEILKALEHGFTHYDLTIVTGGLGPTCDDVTRAAVCEFFQTDLVSDEAALERIKLYVQQRNLPWTKEAEDQALVPRVAKIIPNQHGTAPGLVFERGGRTFIVMPGVPYEMEAMVEEHVVPLLRARQIKKVIRHCTLNTTGISEASLATKVGNPKASVQGAKLAFLPGPTGVRLRITVEDTDANRADQHVAEIEKRIHAAAATYIYGIDNDTMEKVIGKLLAEGKLTISVAESCTGGMVANRITNVPGSSNYFERGVVTYSNRSKIEILGVSSELIERHGAVSREVAEAMASGIRRIAQTDIGLSTTGVAGPTGGSDVKPVGLVWIGYSDARDNFAVKYQFANDRLRFKERASQAAMELVRRRLLNIPIREK
jgi:nicotinamide-nucleotide amidase